MGLPMPYGLKKMLMLELQRSYVTLTLPGPIEAMLESLEKQFYEKDLDQITIDRPIFIIGCHRSGTTALYDTLAKHPDVCYITNASSLLPRASILTHVMGEMVGFDDVVQERFFKDGVTYAYDTPCEGIRIWEHHAQDLETHHMDETYDNPVMDAYVKTIIKKHLKYFGCSRFLNKNPDNSVRTRYIHKLFPDALFIHIVRDARPVVNSLIKAQLKAKEFFGPNHPHAQHATIVEGWPEIKEIWDKKDPVIAASMLWKSVLETIQKDSQKLPAEQFLEIHFEDFVSDSRHYLEKIIEFCQLRRDQEIDALFSAEAEKLSMGNRNEAWKKNFSEEDLNNLLSIVGPTMASFGYVI